MQGNLCLLYELQEALKAISGFAAVTLQPSAGAHGEFTGVLAMRAYHRSRGQGGQTEKTVYQRRCILDVGDYEDPDLEQMQDKIQGWWQEFLHGDLLKIKTFVADLPWQALAEAAETPAD